MADRHLGAREIRDPAVRRKRKARHALSTKPVPDPLSRGALCQSALNIDPLSASKIDPLPAWWLVPVVHRGDRAARSAHQEADAAERGFLWTHRCKPPE